MLHVYMRGTHTKNSENSRGARGITYITDYRYQKPGSPPRVSFCACVYALPPRREALALRAASKRLGDL